MSASSLRERAAKGMAWSTLQIWGGQFLNFLVLVILARLLQPRDFGLVGYAWVFISLVQLIQDQGLTEAIVQREVIEPEHLDTAFWLNVTFGMVSTPLSIVGADLVAGLFREPELAPILRALSFCFIIGSLNRTQLAILRRRMDFKRISQRTLIARTVGGLAGIAAAFGGLGVWSLVIQNLVGLITEVAVLWTVSDWRPGIKITRSHFKDIFGFGMNVLGTRVLQHFDLRVDRLLTGYFLGTTALGFYELAKHQLERLRMATGSITSQVALPAFSQMQSEEDRLRRAFFKVNQYTGLFALPVFTGLVVSAPEIIVVIFGEKWIPTIPVFQILCPVGFLMTIQAYWGQLVIARGYPGKIARYRAISSALKVLSVLLVVDRSIIAIAWAVLLSTFLTAPLFLRIVRQVLPFSLADFFRNFRTASIGTGVMVGLVLAARILTPDTMSDAWRLVFFIAFGVAGYLVTVWRLQPGLFREARNYLRLIRK